MFKKALQLQLRFNTVKGLLNTEQLFGLSISDLSELLKNLNKKIKDLESDSLDFLDENKVNTENLDVLKFEIAKEIYLDKKALEDKAKEYKEIKKHNEEIDKLILEKQQEKLKNLSIEDLEKLRK